MEVYTNGQTCRVCKEFRDGVFWVSVQQMSEPSTQMQPTSKCLKCRLEKNLRDQVRRVPGQTVEPSRANPEPARRDWFPNWWSNAKNLGVQPSEEQEGQAKAFEGVALRKTLGEPAEGLTRNESYKRPRTNQQAGTLDGSRNAAAGIVQGTDDTDSPSPEPVRRKRLRKPQQGIFSILDSIETTPFQNLAHRVKTPEATSGHHDSCTTAQAEAQPAAIMGQQVLSGDTCGPLAKLEATVGRLRAARVRLDRNSKKAMDQKVEQRFASLQQLENECQELVEAMEHYNAKMAGFLEGSGGC